MEFEINNGLLTKCVSTDPHIVIPDGVTVIGHGAFSGMNTLESVVIPDSVEVIEDKAFGGCRNLKDVVICEKTELKNNAFEDCDSLRADEDGFVEINGNLLGVYKPVEERERLVIPEKIHKIFSWCINCPPASFGTLELTDKVTYIHSDAFFCLIGEVIIRSHKTGAVIYRESFSDDFSSYYCEFGDFTERLEAGTLELDEEEPSEAEPENAKAMSEGEEHNKPILEKNRKLQTEVDGVEITVNYKPAAKLRRLYSGIGADTYYDPQKALRHILSPEEVHKRGYAEYGEKYFNSDACMSEDPELDTDAMEPLSEEEQFERYTSFAEICNRAASEDVLRAAARLAQKKKDKTLYKGRVLPIALFMGAEFPCDILELTAKAVSDTELEINLQKRRFGLLEYMNVTKNPILDLIQGGLEAEKSIDRKVEETGKREYIDITCNGEYAQYEKIKLPVVRLKDGRLALNVEPLKPLSEFSCLAGNDKDGYELMNYTLFERSKVEYKGENLPIEPGIMASSGLTSGVVWDRLVKLNQYLHSKKSGRKALDDIKWAMFQSDDIDDETFIEKYLNEEAVLEYAYEIFSCIDAVSEYFRRISLQHIADTAPVYEDSGRLVKRRWWVSVFDTACEKGYENRSERRQEDIRPYIRSNTFVFRKKPMLIPFVGWKGSLKEGFSADCIDFIEQVDWEK